MSLNLGLESLGFDVAGSASYEDLLAEQVEILHDLQDADMAFFDLMNTAKDVSNFNEIVTSLRAHASEECIAFAQDLLGTSVSLEAEDVKIPGEKKGKVMGALEKAWNKIKEWARKIKDWAMKYINKYGRKLGLLEQTAKNPEVTVHWTLKDLDAFMNDQVNRRGVVRRESSGYAKMVNKVARDVGRGKFEKGAKIDGTGEDNAEIQWLQAILKQKLFSTKPSAKKLIIGSREHKETRGSQAASYATGNRARVTSDEARQYINICGQIIARCYDYIRRIVDNHENMSNWSHKRLALSRAFISRLQTVIGYASGDIAAIGKVAAGSAGAIVGKYDAVNSKREDLDEELSKVAKNK